MTENTPSDALVEAMARALAKADNIEICSDAQYRYSSYGIRAQAAAAVIADALAERDAEIARLREIVDRYAGHLSGLPMPSKRENGNEAIQISDG